MSRTPGEDQTALERIMVRLMRRGGGSAGRFTAHFLRLSRTVATMMRVMALRAVRALAKPGARRIIVGSTLASIAIASIAIMGTFSLIHQAPTWWRSVDATSSETVTLAERVEQGMLGAFHRARTIDEPWTIAVTAKQANAWLNVKLPKWLANRRMVWPTSLEEVQVEFADGRISLGFRLVSEGTDQVVAATVAPSLDEQGGLWMALESTRAGRLDLPRRWTIPQLRDWLSPEVRDTESTERLLAALDGDRPLLEDATVQLEDRRLVRVVAIHADEGRLLLTCVTTRARR